MIRERSFKGFLRTRISSTSRDLSGAFLCAMLALATLAPTVFEEIVKPATLAVTRVSELEVNTDGDAVLISTRKASGPGHNLWIGGAGASNTTGASNLAIDGGEGPALSNNTTGNANTALGASALEHNVDGSRNLGASAGALQTNVSGNDNVALGWHSLQASTGDNSIGIGTDSMVACTSHGSDIAIGYQAIGAGACTGSQNIALGTSALRALTSGTSNFAAGPNALAANTNGSDQIAIGNGALAASTTSTGRNVVLGGGASDNSTSAFGNVCTGWDSCSGISSGSENTIVGYSGGSISTGPTTGNYNTIIGAETGGITTGGDNTLIGSRITLPAATSSMVVIADGAGNIVFQCRGGAPTASVGTLQAGSSNCSGTITGIGANTSVTLTLSAAYPTRTRCFIQAIGGAQVFTVSQSASAPVISCFDMAGVAANCVDLSYHCEGQ